MEPAEAIVAVAFSGVAIGVLIMIGSTLKRWIDYKHRKLELQAQAHNGSRQAQQDDYVELLEERVRVLERIATDRTPDLARQIEALRDAHQLDERS